MENYLFERNYGKYVMGKAYEKDAVKIDPKEIEKLIKNGTISIIKSEDLQGTAVKDINITMTYIKDHHKDVYEKIFTKGVESRETEVSELKKQVEDLTAKVAELEAK